MINFELYRTREDVTTLMDAFSSRELAAEAVERMEEGNTWPEGYEAVIREENVLSGEVKYWLWTGVNFELLEGFTL